MTYEAEISRKSPTAFVVLVDQSGSMSEAFGLDARVSKAAFVADVVNKWIDNLVIRCAKGTSMRDYFEVAVIGYGGGVRSALPSLPEGLQPISALAEKPLRIEDRRRIVDDGAGDVVETTVKFRVWVDQRAESDTPMSGALRKAASLLTPWIKQHPDAYPPTVVNITDGAATDENGDPRSAASVVRSLGTSDGSALLLNCHISGFGGSPILYPSSAAGLPDQHAQVVFDMSSPLPEKLVAAAKGAGYPVDFGARGFGYQADAAALVRFLDIGTRAKDLVVVAE